MVKVRVWDLPLRLFHWSLALCVMGLVITGNVGGEAMVWHFRLGYTVLSLLLFRLLWGFTGGHWARWSALPISPRRVWRYLRQPPAAAQPGHNPLGSLSSLALLGMLLLQVGTGLISDDEIATAGTKGPAVSSSLSALATHWHTSTGKLMLLMLVALHVAAIWFYRRFKQRPLTQAMVTGDLVLAQEAIASRDDAGQRWKGLVLFGIAVACVATLLQFAP